MLPINPVFDGECIVDIEGQHEPQIIGVTYETLPATPRAGSDQLSISKEITKPTKNKTIKNDGEVDVGK